MIITYQDTAKFTTFEGNGWTAYFYNRGKRDTAVIYEMWGWVSYHKDVSDKNELYLKLKEAYRNKKSRSFAEFSSPGDSTIEITNKGVFPNILIEFK